MITKLAHTCIHARNLQETVDFYCRGLGLSIAFEFHRKGDRFGCYLDCGSGSFIEIFESAPAQVGNINHLALEVEDMDAVIARLHQEDIPVGEKKLGADNSWQAWLEDPNSVRIELHQYTPESSQNTGRNVIMEG